MQNSYKGKVLISTPDENTDIFSKSVVLIIDHNVDGAFGLILNKKDESVQSNFEEILGINMDIYCGGPLEKNKLFFIVKGNPENEFDLQIDHHFYFTKHIESIINKIGNKIITPNDVKVVIGYSGWSAHQLEDEMRRGCWICSKNFPFEYIQTPSEIWKKSMENLGGKYLLWANTPEDISMN